MKYSEVKQLLEDGGYSGIKTGEFEEVKAMVDRSYRRFARRYGWNIGTSFNKYGNMKGNNERRK
ncbi:MAG: hypothetical protein VW907_03710 [Opitutae bacterium]